MQVMVLAFFDFVTFTERAQDLLDLSFLANLQHHDDEKIEAF